MKVINANQNKLYSQSKELNLINTYLNQAHAILSFINEHIQHNKGLCFSNDINHDTLWNVETLINNSFNILKNNVDNSEVLQHYYIGLYEPLAKAKGTILFVMGHIEDNGKFMFNIDVVANVLLNIDHLINQAIKRINNISGGGNE